MANKIKLISNVGTITSGVAPTTDNLLPGQAVFGKLDSDGKYHLFGNTGEGGDKGRVVDIIVDTIESVVHPDTLEQVLTAGKQTTLDITFDASTGNVTIIGHDGVSVSDGSSTVSMKAGEGFKDNGSAILSANPNNTIDAAEQNQMRSAIDVFSKSEVQALVSKVYRIKGTVQSFDTLIQDTTYTPEEGDVWNIKTAGGKDRYDVDIKAGDNIVYIGPDKTVDWDVVSGTVDLSGYYTKEEVDSIKSTLQSKIDDVQTATDNVKNIADTALDTANTASSAADVAVQTANTSNTTANKAVTTAENAVATADSAVETANNAVETANSAVETSNSASTKADSALGTANEAVRVATAAKTTAEGAVETANGAKDAVDNLQVSVTQLEQKQDATSNSLEDVKDNLLTNNQAFVYKGTIDKESDMSSNYKAGWAYKVNTDGEYQGIHCNKGDYLLATNSPSVLQDKEMLSTAYRPDSSEQDYLKLKLKGLWDETKQAFVTDANGNISLNLFQEDGSEPGTSYNYGTNGRYRIVVAKPVLSFSTSGNVTDNYIENATSAQETTAQGPIVATYGFTSEKKNWTLNVSSVNFSGDTKVYCTLTCEVTFQWWNDAVFQKRWVDNGKSNIEFTFDLAKAINKSDWSKISGSTSVWENNKSKVLFKSCTYDEYNNLVQTSAVDSNTIYFITDNQEIWFGNKKYAEGQDLYVTKTGESEVTGTINATKGKLIVAEPTSDNEPVTKKSLESFGADIEQAIDKATNDATNATSTANDALSLVNNLNDVIDKNVKKFEDFTPGGNEDNPSVLADGIHNYVMTSTGWVRLISLMSPDERFTNNNVDVQFYKGDTISYAMQTDTDSNIQIGIFNITMNGYRYINMLVMHTSTFDVPMKIFSDTVTAGNFEIYRSFFKKCFKSSDLNFFDFNDNPSYSDIKDKFIVFNGNSIEAGKQMYDPLANGDISTKFIEAYCPDYDLKDINDISPVSTIVATSSLDASDAAAATITKPGIYCVKVPSADKNRIYVRFGSTSTSSAVLKNISDQLIIVDSEKHIVSISTDYGSDSKKLDALLKWIEPIKTGYAADKLISFTGEVDENGYPTLKIIDKSELQQP